MHAPPDARDDLRAQDDVGVNLLAAQIEEAVAQPLLLGNLLRARHLERQRLGRREHVERVDVDLDRAGRQRRIDVLVGAAPRPCPTTR